MRSWVSNSSWLLLNSVVVAVLLSSINEVLVSGQCQSHQRQLLLELKSSFNSTIGGGRLGEWKQTTDCCSWEGVSCDAGGQVIGLDLSNQSIFNAIDNSSSLFRLQHLQRLNLAFNQFMSPFPSGFDKFANMTYLNLSNAGFTGQIPAEISQLTSLVSLDLSVSLFLRTSLKLEKPNLAVLVRNLTRLKSLYLDGVTISARGDEWCQALSGSLTELQVLSLSNCNLSGPIHSSLSKLQSLSVIRLDNNNFPAPLPKFFAEFRNLTFLSLFTTALNGRLPEEMFQLPSLQTLDLSNNPLLEGSFSNFPLHSSLQILLLSGTKFGGQVPESIGNLRQLTRIELACCNFSGPIPGSVMKLTELVHLDFTSNSFTGPIPSLSSLLNLTVLNLAFNQLNGTVHSTDWSVLSKLATIELRGNKLSGTIPSTLLRIPSLQKVFLSGNQFNGNLRDFNGKTSSLLQALDLGDNKLQGQIPMSLFEVESLKILTLSSNNLSGFIPWSDIQKLRNLSNLDLSNNNLFIDETTAANFDLSSFPNFTTLRLASCKLTKFPGFLKTQPGLAFLDLSNNQISGEIPGWIWENKWLTYLNLSHNFLTKFEGSLQKNITSSLNVLDLHGNQLQGQIPIFLPYATYLDYSNNNFSSVLPPEIGEFLQFAYFFTISGNKFHGTIPKSLCNASYLRVLDMSNNSLSGPIPQCLTQMMSVSLGVLNLRRNNLSGIISDTFPENCVLQTLDLSRNSMQGKVPKSLANCKMLEVLNLGNNHINDTFPCHLNNISTLRVLVLRSNKFYGNVHCPDNNSTWPVLRIVDLASNSFSGRLHQAFLSTWEAMMADDQEDQSQSPLKHLHFEVLRLNAFYFQDAVTVTVKGAEWELQKISTIFTSIDISCNNFEGPIPQVLGTFGALYVLNFSHNAFTGPIPSSLGNMRQLESLDLSSNNLVGEIPLQLANLNFLSALNLSSNKLVGPIPTSTQLQSFQEASFENNTGLCGPPLNVKCGNESSQQTVPAIGDRSSSPSHSHSGSGSDIDWNFISAEIGFLCGLGTVIAPLIFWKRWRVWYYEQIDHALFRLHPRLVPINRINHGISQRRRFKALASK